MSVELTARIFGVLEAQAAYRLRVPVPLSAVSEISIRVQPDGRQFLRFVLSTATSRAVESMVHCVLESPSVLSEPPATTALTRPWIPMDFYFRTMFGTDAPALLLYRCTPVIATFADVLPAGTAVGSVTTELEVGFVVEDPGGVHRYLDPAIVIRTLALFSDGFTAFSDSFLELLLIAIGMDPVGNFGLTRFITYLQDPALPLYRRRLLEDALRAEYELRHTHAIPPDATTDALYRLFLSPPGSSTTSAGVVSSFEADVEAHPDKVAYFYLSDMDLHFVALRADRYEMDLIDLRAEGLAFTPLAAFSHVYKVLVNGPVFDLDVCGIQNVVKRGIEYVKGCAANLSGVDYKGLTQGRLVFRGRPTEAGTCPISGNPKDWRYHFAQSVTGAYQLHLDPIPSTHDYACAVEPAIGVFRNGLKIGTGNEIDQLNSDGASPRREPDAPYGNEDRVPRTNGIPIIGRCQRLGVEYLFVLLRPDYYTSQFVMTPWDGLVAFLRSIGVVDAFITDGDDSVGLIVEGQGTVWKPGCKKDSVMPLAIGFRKV